MQHHATEVRVDDALVEYLMEIFSLTRESEALELGVSPRGSLSLYRAAQALALIEGRDFCLPDDIKRLVAPAFAHRIMVSSRYSSAIRRSHEAEKILQDILQKIKVPV